MSKALIIIAQDGYQDVELDGTRQGLAGAGFEIVLASKETGECDGKYGGTETAAIAVRDVEADDYDRFAFIGAPGAATFKDDAEFIQLAQNAVYTGNPVGAICIAPTLLAAAGELDGRKATVSPGDGTAPAFLTANGALYTTDHVVTDGNIVTADGPDAAEEFGNTVASL